MLWFSALALTILTNVSSWRLCWRWPLTCCDLLPTQWGRRWLVVLDTTLLYLNPETGRAFKNIKQYTDHCTVLLNGVVNQTASTDSLALLRAICS